MSYAGIPIDTENGLVLYPSKWDFQPGALRALRVHPRKGNGAIAPTRLLGGDMPIARLVPHHRRGNAGR
jgi:hypothetical protein